MPLTFLLLVAPIVAGFITYPPPNLPLDAGVMESPLYRAFVGKNYQQSFVFANNSTRRAQEETYVPVNRSVSWTTIGVKDGEVIEVFVETVGRVLDYCSISPPIASCNVLNNTLVSVMLKGPHHRLSLELFRNREEGIVDDALLLFTDPLPSPPPSPSSSVLSFSAGYHRLSGQETVSDDVKTIYFAPGAVVEGGLALGEGCGVVEIIGEGGVMVGTAFPFLSPDFPWALLEMDAGFGHFVHGLVLVDPPKYYFRSYANGVVLDNLKEVSAWTYNTDGVVTGGNGVIKRSFVRSNDDSLKLYSQGMLVEDVVVWQMFNGAVFQLGWWSSIVREDIAVNKVQVIHNEYCSRATNNWPYCETSTNDAAFSCAKGDTTVVQVSNVTISNVTIYGDITRLLNIELGNNSKGSFSNVKFQDWNVLGFIGDAGGKEGYSIVIGTKAAPITNLSFIDVTINNNCATSPAALNATFDPNTVSNSHFQC